MKHLIKYIIFYFLLLVSCLSFSQTNLVPNPSFEDTIHCPYAYGELDYATSWINPTASSPDYFNSCSSNGFGTPLNIFGVESPHTGIGYGDFGAFSLPLNDYREYIQIQLNTILIQKETYCIEFYVSLTDSSSEYAVNNIGAYFSTNAVSSTGYGPLPYLPQIINP